METCKREFNIILISLLQSMNKRYTQTWKFVNQKSKIITKDCCCHGCYRYLESEQQDFTYDTQHNLYNNPGRF